MTAKSGYSSHNRDSQYFNSPPHPPLRTPLPKSVLQEAKLRQDSHTGLWFERFFNGFESDWSVSNNKEHQLQWLKEITQNTRGDNSWIQRYAETTQRRVTAMGGKCIDAHNEGFFVTGMGISHPIENGLSWHPVLGVPYLNGAAVKGLLRSFFENWTDIPLQDIRNWFGEDENVDKQLTSKTGQYVFFDALPTKPVKLFVDIITPHYGKWYAEGQKINGDSGENIHRIPADWHSPIPVQFLAVKEISLKFAVAPRTSTVTTNPEVLDVLLEGLTMALQWLGAGAKTGAGYGRFSTLKG